MTSAFDVLTCPEDAPWANWLDMSCELDLLDPALATCQCQVVEQGPSFTFGGACDAQTCSSIIWSGATPPKLTHDATAMSCAKHPVTFPDVCPAATPIPSLGATPVSA